MIDALYIGAAGMQVQQVNVDTIANNLSNVNTVGFKKGRVAFTDLVNADAARLASADAAGPLAPAPRAGSGVGVARLDRVFEGGDLQHTGAPLDIAVQGAGFLEVTLADGSRAFSRGGHLKINNEGMLATASGQVLRPGIAVPANARELTVSPAGRVTVTVPGQRAPIELGQLELVRFANPSLLQSLGDGLYRVTDASGEAITARPGLDDSGKLVQGSIEGSNVKLVDEMVNLMVAQRAYAASVKVVQAADEMLGMVNSLRK